MNPLHAEIAQLRARNEALEAEIARLREIAAPARLAVPGVALSRSTGVLLRLLIQRPLVTREQMLFALYQDGPERTDNVVSVLLSKLRRQLVPIGVEIRNGHGVGWWLSPADRARLRQLVAEAS